DACSAYRYRNDPDFRSGRYDGRMRGSRNRSHGSGSRRAVKLREERGIRSARLHRDGRTIVGHCPVDELIYVTYLFHCVTPPTISAFFISRSTIFLSSARARETRVQIAFGFFPSIVAIFSNEYPL